MCFSSVLDVLLMCFGYAFELFSTCVGHVLDCFRSVLDVFWTRVGICSGHIFDIFAANRVGYRLGVSTRSWYIYIYIYKYIYIYISSVVRRRHHPSSVV